MDIQEYVKEDGYSPFQEWFDSLDAIAATKVVVAKSRLAQGNISNVKWFSGIGEYRIDWGPGYRIYLAQDGKELMILFGGGTKRSQQTDIDRAIELHQEYKARKREAQEAEDGANYSKDDPQMHQKKRNKRQ